MGKLNAKIALFALCRWGDYVIMNIISVELVFFLFKCNFAKILY